MANPTTPRDLTALFQSLDAPFLRYERNRMEPILWQAKDFVVQQRHEVKVPSVAGSTVKYSFSTVNGDISFSLQFITTKDKSTVVEGIREPMREPSDVEAIQGSYKADYDGIFLFIFDNSYSWFTDKLLTYSIQLIQPAFALADATRSMQSRRWLVQLCEESRLAKERVLQVRERSAVLTQEIQTIEARLATLQDELRKKQSVVALAQKEYDECTARIRVNEAKKPGVCIRTLEKKLMAHMLSYLGRDTETMTVCKYWTALLREVTPALQR